MPYTKFDENNIKQSFDDIKQLHKKHGIALPIPILPPKELILLEGSISDFKGIGCYVPLMDGAYMTEEQREKQEKRLRSGAAAAMITGNSTAALAALGRADGDDKSNDHPALYMTAKLNDTIQLKGWVGYFKFNDGDNVQVVAEKHPEHYEVYAIVRSEDQVISIIPPCSGGRKKTLKNALLAYLIIPPIIVAVFCYFFPPKYFSYAIGILGITYVIGGVVGFKILMSFLNSYVLLAERIFKTLGWNNPESINLWSMTKKHLKKLLEEGKFSKNDWNPNREISVFYYDKESVYPSSEKNPNNKD